MPRYFAQTWQMYARIPMKNKSILPDEGFAPRLVNIMASDWESEGMRFEVYCKPKPAPGIRWGHRVMVICECGKHIPFGRMNQHYRKPPCFEAQLARGSWEPEE